jgi:hypothetical protein
MADVRVVRGAHIVWDMNIVYDVLVDDGVVGSLPANGSFSYSVSPGSHRIQVRCLPEKEASNVVEIDVGPTQTAELTCSTRPGFAAFNSLLVGRLFHLKLQSVDPQQQSSDIG